MISFRTIPKNPKYSVINLMKIQHLYSETHTTLLNKLKQMNEKISCLQIKKRNTIVMAIVPK